MKKIYFLIAFFAITTSLFSVNTVVYVNQANNAASDDNAGTDPTSPWLTLNAAKWADDMTINIANGTYTITTKIPILNNVILVGQSRAGVILQAMDDATFTAGTTGNTLFQISGKTASFRTMTIKNVRDKIVQLGGAFDVLGNANLSLTDITLTKLIAAQAGWSGGGAIMVRGGTLTVDNCTFDACQSNIGGAIMTFTNSEMNPNQVNVSNTKFIDNGNPKEAFFTQGHFGGAITFSGKGTLNINDCYFEGNKSKLNTSNAGGGTGGAIMVRLDGGATSSLNIKNSFFYKNESDGAGSVLAIGGNGVNTSTVFNLNMTNNVVYQNKGNVYSGSAPNTLALYKAGVDYTGTFIFANNTFSENFNTDRANTSSISIESMPVSAYFINNLMNDNQTGGTTVYGLVGTALTNSATLRRFKGNMLNHLGGGFSVSDAINFPDLFESNINSSNGNRTYVGNSNQKINSSLTVPAIGVPYLETQTGGFGINFGVDEFLVNSVNVVPNTDIRFKGRSGVTDAGAYEFDGITTALQNFIEKPSNSIRYNSDSKTIMLEKQMQQVQIINLNGVAVMSQAKCSEMNISKLPNAIYIIRVTDNDISKNHKIIKH